MKMHLHSLGTAIFYCSRKNPIVCPEIRSRQTSPAFSVHHEQHNTPEHYLGDRKDRVVASR